MSRLEELIEKLCPDGVEYKYFEDICSYVRGVTYNKSKEAQNEDIDVWKVLRANNITLETNTLNFNDVKLIKKEVPVKAEQILRKGDILICAGSGSREHVGKVAYINEDIEYTFGGFMAVVRCDSTLNSRYMYHVLTGNTFSMHLDFAMNSTTINNLSLSVMSKFQIPVPPLEVQSEIVRILDNFTELTAELTEKLTAELTARKKQYEYYRDELLTFRDEVEYISLGDLADIKTGIKPKEIFEIVGEYEYINAGTTNSGYVNDYNCEDAVTTPSRGQGGIGFVGYQKDKFWLGPLCYRIQSKNKEKIINKYLYYYLLHNNHLILGIKKEGGVPAVNRVDLEKIVVETPPLEEQQRIVDILDRFDKLCNDISEGLPAEIEARQKQYEYYRDKLLTFKEKAI